MTTSLCLEHIHHAYDDQVVLRGIDLELQPGDFVALIGPNGSGKSTLLHCIAGILAPRSGRVVIGGIDLAKSPRAAKQRLGFAIDPARLPERLTGRECLQLFAGARDLADVPSATLALADTLALSPMLDRSIGRYSLGSRQKLGILLGLLGEPPLLVLDEPFNGLDPVSAHALKRHLQALACGSGATVLLATHSLDVAERFITRALLLMEGQLLRSWDAAELEAIRNHPDRSLELAMVEAMGAPRDS